MYFWPILAGILAIAFGLGYFLAFGPLVIITAIGVAFLCWINANLNDGSYKGSGGIAEVYIIFAIIALLLVLCIGAGVRSLVDIPLSSINFSAALHEVRDFLFR